MQCIECFHVHTAFLELAAGWWHRVLCWSRRSHRIQGVSAVRQLPESEATWCHTSRSHTSPPSLDPSLSLWSWASRSGFQKRITELRLVHSEKQFFQGLSWLVSELGAYAFPKSALGGLLCPRLLLGVSSSATASVHGGPSAGARHVPTARLEPRVSELAGWAAGMEAALTKPTKTCLTSSDRGLGRVF